MGTLLAAFERSIRFRIRGLDGKTLREFSHVQGGGWSWQKDWIYRHGQLLGTDSAASGVRHAHNDHLGTPRVFSDVFGNYQERRHLYPFGEQALATGPAPVTMTFTGHERDGNWTTATADDLDYMMARYYHPQLGRFLSTDPSRRSFDPSEPISWNRYAYVKNNPLGLIDPDGEDPQDVISKNGQYKFHFDYRRHGGPHVDIHQRAGRSWKFLGRVSLPDLRDIDHMGKPSKVTNQSKKLLRKILKRPDIAKSVSKAVRAAGAVGTAISIVFVDEANADDDMAAMFGEILANIDPAQLGVTDLSQLSEEQLQALIDTIMAGTVTMQIGSDVAKTEARKAERCLSAIRATAEEAGTSCP